jgi:hypothetical protein
MGEARRYPQLMPVRRRQLNCYMTPISRRADSDIDGYVENRSPHAPHQLALRMRWRLKVQAAKHAFLRRMNVIVLHEDRFDAVCPENVRAKGLGEKSTLIAVFGWLYQQDVRNFQALDLHCRSR